MKWLRHLFTVLMVRIALAVRSDNRSATRCAFVILSEREGSQRFFGRCAISVLSFVGYLLETPP